jgi:hypothetical protein
VACSWAKLLVQKKREFFFSGLGQKKEGKKKLGGKKIALPQPQIAELPLATPAH